MYFHEQFKCKYSQQNKGRIQEICLDVMTGPFVPQALDIKGDKIQLAQNDLGPASFFLQKQTFGLN